MHYTRFEGTRGVLDGEKRLPELDLPPENKTGTFFPSVHANCMMGFNRHSPDYRFVGRDLRFDQGGAQSNSIAATPACGHIVGLLGPRGCDPSLCVHQGIPLPSSSAPFGPEARHAGAGGARNREI